MNARASTTIFLIYKTFKGLFLFKITILKSYVCNVKKTRYANYFTVYIQSK